MDPVALAQAGPVAILLVFISAIVIGAIRGYWVPGWLYVQERDQRLKAEVQAERNSESLALLARFADARRLDPTDRG